MRRALFAILSTIVALVLVLSFKTHSTSTSLAAPPAAIAPSTSDSGTSSSGSSGSSGTSGSSSTSSGSGTSSGSSTSTSKTVTGTAADTRYGPVQVKITVTNGQLTAVTAVEYPTSNPRDEEINSVAIPQLTSEALTAKSAQIDMVSGATYTSEGYISSLQSALDQAGLR